VFKEMFASAAKYRPSQILTAAEVLFKAEEYDIALEAFDRVLSADDARSTQEPAMLGKAKLLIAQGKLQEGTTLLEELMTKYPNTGFTVEASLQLSTAYADLGMKEADDDKRFDLFNNSVKWMRKVRQFHTEPGDVAQSDVEVGKILKRKAAAEKEFGTPDQVERYRNDAIATFQTLILLGDINNPKVRQQIDEAYYECMPLLLEAEKWKDVRDDCDRYLELFPSGKHVLDIRKWRSKARVKLATEGGLEEETTGEEEAEEAPGASE
jgi:tetratricopeptide (TPR) repeat protein